MMTWSPRLGRKWNRKPQRLTSKDGETLRQKLIPVAEAQVHRTLQWKIAGGMRGGRRKEGESGEGRELFPSQGGGRGGEEPGEYKLLLLSVLLTPFPFFPLPLLFHRQ